MKVKKGVIHDTINLLNLSVKKKNRIKNQKKAELQKRLLKPNSINKNIIETDGKSKKKNEPIKKPEPEKKDTDPNAAINQALLDKASWKEHLAKEKAEKKRKKRLVRERVEKNKQGNYDLIYPLVSYAEEDMVTDRVAAEKETRNIGKEPKKDKPND
jgi:hypothetical protein